MALKRKEIELTQVQKKLLKDKQDKDKRQELLRSSDYHRVLSLSDHESIWCVGISKTVTRVYNGWIYSSYDENKNQEYNSVFVPDNSIKLT
jgi:hypothetical protein